MRNPNLSEAEIATLDTAIRELLALSNWHDAAADGHTEHRRAADVAGHFATLATALTRQADPYSVDAVLGEVNAGIELLRSPNPTPDLVDAVWLRTRHANVLARLASPHR